MYSTSIELFDERKKYVILINILMIMTMLIYLRKEVLGSFNPVGNYSEKSDTCKITCHAMWGVSPVVTRSSARIMSRVMSPVVSRVTFCARIIFKSWFCILFMGSFTFGNDCPMAAIWQGISPPPPFHSPDLFPIKKFHNKCRLKTSQIINFFYVQVCVPRRYGGSLKFPGFGHLYS
jgi:hypothetical protein